MTERDPRLDPFKRFLVRFFFLTLMLAALAYPFGVLISAVGFYRSTSDVTAEDFRALDEMALRLDGTLRDGGAFSNSLASLSERNRELKAEVVRLRQAQTQAELVGGLDRLSASLDAYSDAMGKERASGAATVARLGQKVNELKQKVGPAATAPALIGSALRGIGTILAAVAWPLLVAAVLLVLWRSQTASETVTRIFRPFKSVKLFAAELVLSDEAKSRAEGTFDRYRKQAVEQYDLFVQRKRLVDRFDLVRRDAVAIIKEATGSEPEKYRCTLHVPDLVFADTLYQLLNYLPSGAGSGRIFSIRFGLIGRVWRGGESEIQKFGTKLEAGKRVVDEVVLVREWGMSPREAKTAAEGRPAFLAVLLADPQGIPVGIFYMDATKADAFDVKVDDYPELTEAARQAKQEEDRRTKTRKMLGDIAAKCAERKIDEDLVKMNDELGGRAPLIRVYEK